MATKFPHEGLSAKTTTCSQQHIPADSRRGRVAGGRGRLDWETEVNSAIWRQIWTILVSIFPLASLTNFWMFWSEHLATRLKVKFTDAPPDGCRGRKLCSRFCLDAIGTCLRTHVGTWGLRHVWDIVGDARDICESLHTGMNQIELLHRVYVYVLQHVKTHDD